MRIAAFLCLLAFSASMRALDLGIGPTEVAFRDALKRIATACGGKITLNVSNAACVIER